MNPGLAVAYRNRGELLAATGRTEEAVADYTTALAQLPQDADLHAMRGEAYHRLGQYEEAIADLTQSIENSPLSAAVVRPARQRATPSWATSGGQSPTSARRSPSTPNRPKSTAAWPGCWLRVPTSGIAIRGRRSRRPQRGRESRGARRSVHARCLGGGASPTRANSIAPSAISRKRSSNVPGDFAESFNARLALYEQRRPFRNGATDLVDENVRAASLEAAPRSTR